MTNPLLFEGMISIRAVIESKSRPIDCIYYSTKRKLSHVKEFAWLTHRSEEMNFKLEETDSEYLDEICDGNSHGGIAALCKERILKFPEANDISENGFYLMLDGIEDPFNFGFAVRSAYATGCDGIILPKRNWMDSAGIVARSSAGASERIAMYEITDESFIDIFKEKGYTVYCAIQKDSVSVFETELKKPLLLIIGGEKRGISKSVLEKSDINVRIDYARDFPEALSAASACAILSYEVSKNNRQ